MVKAGSLWQVLPQQPIGVLIGPALPRVVRRRKVELHSRLALDLLVPVELRPVVRSDRLKRSGVALDQLDRCTVCLGHRARVELGTREPPCSLPFLDRSGLYAHHLQS